MTKIMLVEDDNNLREIYEARLAAEGYDIVAAPDGEAALAMAGRERPDLVITDVMMPKISGFEMLDILRNTDALKGVKVIMLTALGQAEDNARAGALGADRYLVKSQVTLEDIVKAAHDLLEEVTIPAGDAAAATAAAAALNGDGGDGSDGTGSISMASDSPQTDQTDTVHATTENAATSDATAIDADIVLPEPTLPEPALPNEAPATAPATIETETAQSAVQEESDIRAQIDQFVENVDAGQPLTAATATETAPAAPESAQQTAPEASRAEDSQLAEASEDDLQRDAAAPDMGQLSVHEAPVAEPSTTTPVAVGQPQAPAAPAAAQPAAADYTDTQSAASMPAGYPSQSFDLPTVPGAAIGSQDPAAVTAPPAAPATETAGDKIVSDAVNTLLTDVTQKPEVLPPSQAAAQTTLPGSQPSPAPVTNTPAVTDSSAAPEQQNAPTTAADSPNEPANSTAPAPNSATLLQAPAPTQEPVAGDTAGQPDAGQAAATPTQLPSATRRVISPISQPTNKPDINQLLAMEDAKAAAAQAAQQQGQPAPATPYTPAPAPATPPAAPAAPQPAPQTASNPGGTPPPIDPNAVAM